MFFGSRHNLIMPGDARTHGRRLGDQAAARAAGTTGRSSGSAPPGTIQRVEVDTRHFKGNAPGACSLEACLTDDAAVRPAPDGASWRELLPRTPLQPHARHAFDDDAAARSAT